VLRQFQEGVLAPAGLPKMRVHDLRHSAVAILHAQGVRAVPHQQTARTLQRFVHAGRVRSHLPEAKKGSSKPDGIGPRAPLVPIPVAPSLAPSRRLMRVK